MTPSTTPRLMVDQRCVLLPVLDAPRLVGVIRYAAATGPENTRSGLPRYDA